MPDPVAALAADVAVLPAIVAVVLGGSRAVGSHRPDSDWDLGLYYRGSEAALDPADVRRLVGESGVVSALGEWGPIVNGGAWLTLDGTPVDLLFPDLDVVEPWMRDAEEGRFEILTQNGYVVGAPTYLLIGELAMCRPLHGELRRPVFPEPLVRTAPGRWNGRAGVSLTFATGYAEVADAVACTGMLAGAILSAAHARLTSRREWVLNEKRLVERAGLARVQRHLGAAGTTRETLRATVGEVTRALGVEPLGPR